MRFTPGCCCSYVEPKNYKKPCIPNCTLIYDGLLNTDVTPVADLLPLIRNARLCSGDSWWRGFYFTNNIIGNGGTVHTETDVTTDYGGANSLIYIVGYSNGVRDGIDRANYGQNLVNDISDKLQTTNNTNGINSYFQFDNIDQKWHYVATVTEPSWITVWSIPWNYERFDIEFEVADDTEASWLAAPAVRVSVPSPLPSPYLQPSDCGFYPLTVSDDFSDNFTRWEQWHTGTYAENIYSIDASGLDSWISSQVGQHHYGSDYFWVDYVLFHSQYGNHTYTESESIYVQTKYSPVGCECSSNWCRVKFYRDEPDFTPMFPTGYYSISRQTAEYDSDNDNHFTRYNTMGSKNSIPDKWGGMDNTGFIGNYYPETRAYSYNGSMLGYTTINIEFPLGLYSYTNKPTTLDNVTNVARQTQPCPIRKGTLVKDVNHFTYDDFWFPIIGRSGYDSLNFGIPQFPTSTHIPGKLIGFYPAYLVFTKYNTTPSALLHGDVVFGCRSAYVPAGGVRQERYGYGYYVDNQTGVATADSTALGWVADREPGTAGEMIDTVTARFNNYNLHDNNTYLKSFEVGWRTLDRYDSTTGELINTYWVPSIPQGILSELVSNLWVWTGTSQLTDKTWYYVPTIYITGYMYR